VVRASISAVDFAGNQAWASAGRIQVRRDTTSPVVKAQLVGNALFWRATDRLCQRLRGVLVGPGRTPLGDIARSGVRGLLPGVAPPTWLLVADSSGNTARVRLSGSQNQPPALQPLRPPSRDALIWVR
jgi:hypothetical protein